MKRSLSDCCGVVKLMMCSTCRSAGLLNEKGLWLVGEDRLEAAEHTFSESEGLHDDCSSSGCTCQHFTRLKLSK